VNTCRYLGLLRRAANLLARKLLSENRAAQLVEFAVALPLLMVFVVGIFDFSGAFTLKQKLTNAARDAARSAAAEPINDLVCATCTAPPASVSDAFGMVDSFLQLNKINDCGIGSLSWTKTLANTWAYSATGNGCAGTGLKITINRGYYFPATGGIVAPTVSCAPQSASGQTAVISTCVSIQYAYQWKFGKVASLLGSTPVLPNTISATAVAMNEN
jgi:Flp pilus assembly protein TadG